MKITPRLRLAEFMGRVKSALFIAEEIVLDLSKVVGAFALLPIWLPIFLLRGLLDLYKLPLGKMTPDERATAEVRIRTGQWPAKKART